MTNSVERELGGIQARLRQVETDVVEIKGMVREVRDTAVSVKGGWKTISIIAGIGLAIGTLISKFADFFTGGAPQ